MFHPKRHQTLPLHTKLCAARHESSLTLLGEEGCVRYKFGEKYDSGLLPDTECKRQNPERKMYMGLRLIDDRKHRSDVMY